MQRRLSARISDLARNRPFSVTTQDFSGRGGIVAVIARMLLFGATGDLAGRFLLPALARLQASGQIPEDFRVVGAAREGWDDATFQRHGAQQLEEHASDVSDGVRRTFVRCLRYRAVDFVDLDSVARAVASAQSIDDPGATPSA